MVIKLRSLLFLRPKLLFLVLERGETGVQLSDAIKDSVGLVLVAFGVADQGVAVDVVGGVDRGHYVLEWVVIIAARADALVAELLLYFNIIKPVLLAEFAEFLAYYLLDVLIRECLS